MENKRIVLLNGDSSSWFEQAIIIVKDGQMRDGFEGGRPTPSLVEQAERIVNGYNPFKAYQKFAPKAVSGGTKPQAAGTGNSAQPRKSAKGSSFDTFLNVVVLVSCVVLAGVLITQL